VKRYDLFAHGTPTEYTGEWRHVGTFQAPNHDAAREVAKLYMQETGITRVRVFTAKGSIGRMVSDHTRGERTLLYY
jgi:hypothetical protein